MFNEESENTEYKASLSEWKDGVKSVAAFAAIHGGTIIFGVNPSGKTVGVDIGDNTLENLANDIKRNTDPPQFPSIVQETWDGKTVVVVRVTKSPELPVLAFGCPYKRVGRTNQRLSSAEVRRMSLESTGTTWDMLTCVNAMLGDIDGESIQRYLEQLRRIRGLDLGNAESTEDVLRKLRLLESGGISNTAILLFGKEPQRFYQQSEVRCARFKGTDSVDFLDMKVITGNLILQVGHALLFVERHTSTTVKITGQKLEREERNEYPVAAVREALANAVCHRDYTDTGNVQVGIVQ